MSAFAISDTSSFQENAARLSIAVQNRQPMVAFLGRRQFSFTFSPLNERLHSFTSCHDDAGLSQGFDSSFVSFFVKAKCFFPNLSSLQKITTVAVQVATHPNQTHVLLTRSDYLNENGQIYRDNLRRDNHIVVVQDYFSSLPPEMKCNVFIHLDPCSIVASMRLKHTR